MRFRPAEYYWRTWAKTTILERLPSFWCFIWFLMNLVVIIGKSKFQVSAAKKIMIIKGLVHLPVTGIRCMSRPNSSQTVPREHGQRIVALF